MFHLRISWALGKCYPDVKRFYSNEEKLRLHYDVSNFAINQPMLPVYPIVVLSNLTPFYFLDLQGTPVLTQDGR